MAKRILVVDDDPDIREVLRTRLSHAGYEVIEAEDGIAAFDVAHTERLDLVIADIMMPGVDGFQLVQTLLQQPRTRDVPVIFLSARGDVDDRVKGLRLGAWDYITKPFQFAELLARVEGALARAEAQRVAAAGDAAISGNLSHMPFVELAQSLEGSNATGELALTRGETKAIVYFLEGRITGAHLGELSGKAAFFSLMAWTEGSFQFRAMDPPDRAPLASSNLELFLEASAWHDEARQSGADQ